MSIGSFYLKINMTNLRKAKSCPRPTKKQNRVHNLPKSKSGTTALRKPMLR